MHQKNDLELGKEPNGIDVVEDTSDVKKLNKNPILIITGIVIVLVLALLYAASQRGTKTPSVDTMEVPKTSSAKEVNKEEFLAGLEKGSGAVPPTPIGAEGDPLADPFAKDGAVPPTPTSSANGGVPPTPNDQAKGGVNPPNMFEAARRERIMQTLKYDAKALDIPTKTGLMTEAPKVNLNDGGSNIAPRNEPSLMEKYLSLANGTGGAFGQTTDQSDKNKKFLGEAVSYDYLASKKSPQLSPFEVKTGTVIPAVLITGVNSELPGKMKAQISENVYDTATGKYLLIPQGATLIGDYSSNVVYGQSRVLVAWNRIVFPDGHTLNLGNMNGIDREGYSGFQDEVDNHYFRIFGSALIMSSITGGVAVSSNNKGNQMTQTPSDQMIAAMIDQLGQVGIQMIQKNLNIAPTIMIRSGYKFNVFVTKDMKLEPLKIKLR